MRRGGVVWACDWSAEEVDALRASYSSPSGAVKLADLAEKLGRNKANVCRKARELGLTNQRRRKHDNPKQGPRFATDEERRAFLSDLARERIAKNGHPRGALGMKHTEETKKKLAADSRRKWADPNSKFNSAEFRQRQSDVMLQLNLSGAMNSGYSRTRGGKRSDLGNRYFRSAWEANYARYLNFLLAKGEIAGWDYECQTFTFDAINRGTRAYTPDFKVVAHDGSHVWHEVKGWMDATSKTRLKRMAKYYPKEQVIVIGAEWFRAASRGPLPGLIAGWEKGTTR